MGMDIMGQMKGLLDDPQVVEQLQGLLPEGTDIGELLQDPGKLLDTLKDSPDLLNKLQELVPDVDLEGALSSLTGAAGDAASAAAGAAGAAGAAAAGAAGGTADVAAGAATNTAGGIIDSVKGLFGKR
jgi:hypothetical protein